MPRMVVQPAYAKLNLNLLVGPPIPAGQPKAGYHPIVSLMDIIDLYDDVEVRALAAGEASRYSISWADDAVRPTPIDWPVEKDLAVRAHRLLEEHVGRPLPVDLKVRKRIPVGGGLGGGSSDAAAVLVAISRAYDLSISREAMMELGGRLGSDVPFLVGAIGYFQSPAVVTGLGEQVRPMCGARSDPEVLLMIPPFGCATREMYAKLDKRRAQERQLQIAEAPLISEMFDVVLQMAESGRDFGKFVHNDFLIEAIMLHRDLKEFDQLWHEKTGRRLRMTGSGSTFVLMGDHALVEQTMNKMLNACQTRAKSFPDRYGWMADVKFIMARFV